MRNRKNEIYKKSQPISKPDNLPLIAYLVVFFICLLSAKKSLAQIIPDQTLPVNSQVTPGCTICQINGGTVMGVNLFHSFQQFSVPQNGQALFNNGAAIQNIFTRVTGNTISNINGLIQTNGNTNLFLLNPNGIIFGPNAQLNVGGSFLATTASSFKFFDGSEFSAVNPQAPPLLTVNITPGLQYGQSPPGATIVNRGNLTVGKDLTLLADQLDIQGQLQSGRDLTLQAQNTVQITDTSDIFNYTNIYAQRDLIIQGNQSIDISTVNDRSGLISGRDMLFIAPVRLLGNISLTTGGYFITELLDGTIVDFLSPHQQIIKADGDVNLGDYTGLSLYILASGQVQLGNVTIISDNNGNYDKGSVTQSIADGRGGTQTITVNANNDIGILDVRSGINPQKLPPGLLDNTSSVVGANPVFSHPGNPTNSDIIVGQLDSNGNFVGNNITNSGGSVVLTNQYLPSPRLQNISGNIRVGNIDTHVQDTANTGDISLTASGNIETQSITSYAISSSGGADNQGSIFLSAGGNISTQDISSSTQSNSGSSGNGGAIALSAGGNISTQSLYSYVQSNFGDAGNGGVLALSAGGNISTQSLYSYTFANSGFANNGGAIALSAGGNISTQSLYSYTSSEQFNPSITKAINQITDGKTTQMIVDTSSGSSFGIFGFPINSFQHESLRNSGSITMQSGGDISLHNLSTISTNSLSPNGNAGDITLIAQGNISVPQNLNLTANKVSGLGNSGNINMQAGDEIVLNGGHIQSAINDLTEGNGGNIDISTNSLFMTNGTQLNTSSLGTGNAGNINIQATKQVSLDGTDSDQNATGIYSQLGPDALGNAGDIHLTTNSLSVTNGAVLSTNSLGHGNAGNINIQATEQVSLDGTYGFGQYSSGVYSQLASGAVGNGGNINLATNSLSVTNGALISTSSAGQGNAGNINIQATKQVSLDGTDSFDQHSSGVYSQLVAGAVGNGGDIDITSNALFMTNGAKLNTNSSGQGNAGNINIQATKQVSLDGEDISGVNSSGLYSQINLGGVGNGGNINLTTNSLSVTQGAQISTSALGQGNAGNINIQADEQAFVDGVSSNSHDSPSLIASIASNTGTGGNLNITTNQMNITNGGKISVSSPTGQAGSLTIRANNLFLNQGELTAETGLGDSGDNANIILSLSNSLFMRNQSLISAQAFNQAKGGNITIDAPNGFVIAVPSENSDINANASYGNGGSVKITTQEIFGTEYRLFNTSESDITASSQFGTTGQVIINQLNVDPIKGLQIFPTTILDTSNQIAQRCSEKGKLARRQNQFTITGKGRLPSNPEDLLTGTTPLVSLVESISHKVNHQDAKISHDHEISVSPSKIVEAQGWIVDDQGEVRLIANAVNTISHSPVISHPYCPNP